MNFKKKYRRDRVMRLNSFQMQDMRDIGRKEAGEQRVFLLWLDKIATDFLMKGKICKNRKTLKYEEVPC